MTLAPSLAPALRARSLDPNRDPIAFMRRRFGDQDGWCCIGHINGDPSLKKGQPGYVPLKEEWFRWPAQAPALRERLRYLVQHTAGNVYAAPCLFTEPKRSYETALPSRWLWRDDASADAACSELVQTSEGSYQAWLLVDRALSAEERRDFQRRWRQAEGGDTCSADAIHMARLPGGYNTKRHGRFPVRVTIFDSTPQSIETLQQAWPTSAPTSASPVDWQRVDLWHGNLSALLGADGLPRRLKPKSQTRRILASGTPEDTSTARYIVARGLLMHGYELDEAATLLLALTDWGKSAEKGSAWLEEDVSRILSKAAAELGDHYRPTPTRFQATRPATRRPQVERRKRGRPRTAINAVNYAQWLLNAATGEWKVLGTRKENAAQLGCSVPHLDRLEKVLRDAGALTRHTTKSRRDSWLQLDAAALEAFLGAIKNTSAPIAEAESAVLSEDTTERAAMPESAPTPQQEKHTPDAAASPAPGAAPTGGCALPTAELTPTRPTLAEVIAEAVEAYGPKLRPARKHAAMYGYDDAEAVKLAHTRHIWSLERAAVRALDDAELLKVCEGRRKALARNIGKPREGYYRVRHSIADDERRRRRLEAPAIARKARAEAAPASEGHAPLLELLEAPTTPAPNPYGPGYVAGMLERLRARQALTA